MQYKTTLNFYERFQVKYEGHVYHSTNPKDLVIEMRGECFIPSENVHDFMKEFSARCYMWDSSIIRYDSEENFVEDLLTTDFIEIINLN
jgi:hypothetical protein